MVTITQKGTKTLLQDVCCVSVSPKYNKSLLQSVGWVMLFAPFADGLSLQGSVNFEVNPATLKIQFSPRRKHRRQCNDQQQINCS